MSPAQCTEDKLNISLQVAERKTVCGRSQAIRAPFSWLGERPLAHTGTAVFLFGLKNGNFTTVASAFSRTASIVTSIWSLVPGLE